VSALAGVVARVLRRAADDGSQRGERADGGLYLTAYPGGVVNVCARERDLTRADVDAVRAALGEAGYAELESWVAAQGVSWLSAGMQAGVSFRVARQPDGNRPATRTC
jgi:hypothetical protein